MYDFIIQNPPFKLDTQFMLNSLSNAKHLVHLAPLSWAFSVNKNNGFPAAKSRLKSLVVDDSYGKKYFAASIQNFISIAHFVPEEQEEFSILNEKYGTEYKQPSHKHFGRNINPKAYDIVSKLKSIQFPLKESSRYLIRLPRKLGLVDDKDILGGKYIWSGSINSKSIIQKIDEQNINLSMNIYFDTLQEAEQVLNHLKHPISRMRFVTFARSGGFSCKIVPDVIATKDGSTSTLNCFDFTKEELQYAEDFCKGHIDGRDNIFVGEPAEDFIESRAISVSKERKKKTDEIFTSPWAVQKMINLIPKEVLLGTFMEPAAGEGNILLAVMKEKLKYQSAEEVARTCHAIEYMEDNHRMMVERAVQILGENNRTTIEQNIKQGDGTNFEWFHKARCPEPTRTLEDILVTL